MSKQVVAIIPARGGSKGIKLKNLQEVGGIPLVAHAIKQAKESSNIDHVVVSTENAEIREAALLYGAEVLDRPEEFHHDSTVQEVDRLLQWTVAELEGQGSQVDVVVLLYPTAPLRPVDKIEQAVEMVLEEGYDSVLSLYEDTTYLWATDHDTVHPTNYEPAKRGPRQKEHWNQWAENKAIYAMRRDLLMDTGCRLGGKIGYVEMSKLDSIDVDTPDELALVRHIFDQRSR